MLPIGIAIIKQLNENKIFGKVLMLGIAYSFNRCSNCDWHSLKFSFSRSYFKYRYEITFQMVFVWISNFNYTLFFCWIYLTRVAYKFESNSFPGGKQNQTIKKELGPISYEEKLVASFCFSRFVLISRSFFLQVPTIIR